MDVSFHLCKQPSPVCAGSISCCISFPIVWEINRKLHKCWVRDFCAWLLPEHGTHILVEPREKILDTWFPNVETWRFLIVSRKTTLLWGSLFWRSVEELCPPCVRLIHSSIASTCTPVQLTGYKNASLGWFHDNRHRDFNTKRKAWRI